MTPKQKIKREILNEIGYGDFTDENIDERYNFLLVNQCANYDLENEFRESGEKTNIECPLSRLYESQSVARKLSDGTWIGWTYWFGGGKHGEPEAIDWMTDAYELKIESETEKVIIIRTFSKCEKSNA